MTYDLLSDNYNRYIKREQFIQTVLDVMSLSKSITAVSRCYEWNKIKKFIPAMILTTDMNSELIIDEHRQCNICSFNNLESLQNTIRAIIKNRYSLYDALVPHRDCVQGSCISAIINFTDYNEQPSVLIIVSVDYKAPVTHKLTFPYPRKITAVKLHRNYKDFRNLLLLGYICTVFEPITTTFDTGDLLNEMVVFDALGTNSESSSSAASDSTSSAALSSDIITLV